MKIAAAGLSPVRYVLRESIATSRGSLSERRGWCVQLRDAEGRLGQGEALPLPEFGTETQKSAESALRQACGDLRGRSAALAQLLDDLESGWPDAPAARCALDVALHDLTGQRQGASVAQLLSPAPHRKVEVNAVLGRGEPAAVAARAAAAARRGFGTLKLKAGEDVSELCAALAEVRGGLGERVELRVDANGAWTEQTAERALARLEPFRLQLIEQPTAAADLAALRRLHARSSIPLAADEALADPGGREALLRGDLAAIAILKPMALGGLRPAARLAEAAARVGVRSLVTTTFEGPVGTAAALQLAAAIGREELACGIASSEMVDADFPAFLTPERGALIVPATPGLGLEPEA